MVTLFRTGACGLAILAVAGAMPAVAQQAPTAAAPPATTAVTPAADAPPPDAFGEQAVDDATLGRETGREDLGAMVASATQRNTVASNSVVGTSATGAIAIDGNAFQNLQGLAVISANSGNNVAMNSAMNVTISMAAQ